ncbi:hypothetical protein TREVI0001_0021 [Treponema vincentii ATCC 35580]|uniref:Uncharacterized protein n=1 Tax=Treponema vincentii ATCC 35580 TaxID=596324 RepID=C8PRN8_9SPIR|nr:hypothetical protein TREVI0001_0021 [Treponema vincentii ATCC 35580]
MIRKTSGIPIAGSCVFHALFYRSLIKETIMTPLRCPY